jgi:aldose 1-epimerase
MTAQVANYTAEKTTVEGVEIIRLTDRTHKTEVSIAPSIGNNAYEMKVNGKNVFWFPFDSVSAFQAKPAFCGNPFLAPWANRLDHEGFYANGKHYKLNSSLQNYRHDSFKQPIHGLTAYTPRWKVVEVKDGGESASVTSRLEFWRYPDWLAQFPFAHTIDMTYRLQGGVLEVQTTIENYSTEPMPLSVGYHPYFQVHDAPRDEWKVQLPAREQVVLSKELVPTGETRPNPYSNPHALAGSQLDDVFSGLIRGESGRAEFSVQGAKQKIAVLYGPKYPVAVVYAPPGRNFICFEPMSGPTNAFNLHHVGKYKELQTVPPGGKWSESFWIQASGF